MISSSTLWLCGDDWANTTAFSYLHRGDWFNRDSIIDGRPWLSRLSAVAAGIEGDPQTSTHPVIVHQQTVFTANYCERPVNVSMQSAKALICRS